VRRLTVAEAAKISNRHPDTLRRALACGELHGAQRVRGGRWSIRPECLDAWLDGEPCEHQGPRHYQRRRA
jgi:excisionase family DNA binding protein